MKRRRNPDGASNDKRCLVAIWLRGLKSIGKVDEFVYCGLGMPRKAGANAGEPHLIARWFKWSVFEGVNGEDRFRG